MITDVGDPQLQPSIERLTTWVAPGCTPASCSELAHRVKLMRNHGYSPKYYNKVVGGNFRLDAIQAAVLRVKLRYLDQWTESRQDNAATYRNLFGEAGLCVTLDEFSASSTGVVLPFESPDVRHIYNQFVIRSHRRDELVSHLKERQIGTEIYYPVPMHMQECFADLGYRKGGFPASECAADQTLALPIYPELTLEMLETVVGAIAEFLYEQGEA